MMDAEIFVCYCGGLVCNVDESRNPYARYVCFRLVSQQRVGIVSGAGVDEAALPVTTLTRLQRLLSSVLAVVIPGRQPPTFPHPSLPCCTQFPRLRFAMRSRLFWVGNARLVSSVVLAVAEESRGECVRILVEEATTAKASAAHEDKRSFDCTAAEVGAGIMAVLSGDSCWAGGGSLLRETVLPFVETELEGGSLDGRLDW